MNNEFKFNGKTENGFKGFNLSGVKTNLDYSANVLGRRKFEREHGIRCDESINDSTPVYLLDKVVRGIKLDKNRHVKEGEEKLHDGEYILVGSAKSVNYIVKDVASALTVYAETDSSVAVYMEEENLAMVVRAFPSATVVAGFSDVEKALSITSNVCDINSCGDDIEERRVIGGNVFESVIDYYRAGGDVNVCLKTGRETRLVPLWWALKRAKKPSWIIEGLLPDSPGLAVLYSAPNVGKTYLVIDMAMTIASGKGEWCGRKTKSGKVLYLCGEGNGAFFARIKCWLQENGNIDPEKVDLIYEKKLFNFDLESDYSEFVRCLEKRCKDEKPKLVVIDTMNLYMSRDENSTEETSSFLKTLKTFCLKFNCTILLVHHTGLKEEKRERGSSTIRGSVDSSLMLSNIDGIRKLEQVKNRSGELAEPMYFVLEKHGVEAFTDDEEEGEDPVIDCVIRQISAPHKAQFTKAELFLIDFCLYRYERNLPWGSFSRSDMIEYGRKVLPETTVPVATQFNPKQKGKLLNALLRDKVVKAVTDERVEEDEGRTSEMYEIVSEKMISTVEGRIQEKSADSDDTDAE